MRTSNHNTNTDFNAFYFEQITDQTSNNEQPSFNATSKIEKDIHIDSRTTTKAFYSDKRWICNISEHLKFAKKSARQIHITANEKYDQFSIMCKLLSARTCDIIYFDAHLTNKQFDYLRFLQAGSKTELVNARMHFHFERAAC